MYTDREKKQKGDIIWQQDVIFRKKRIRYRLTGLWKQLEIMIEIIVETDKEGVMMNIQELEKESNCRKQQERR